MTEQEQSHFSGKGVKFWKAGTIALALLALFLFTKTISEIKGWNLIGAAAPQSATITVSGKGEIVVKPDIATFSFGIQEESLIVSDAQTAAAKSENDILNYLKTNGVSADDIKVSDYNIYPRYEYPQTGMYGNTGKQVLAAYVVSESVSVKVRKISDAGKLIGSLGELGATNLSGLTFSVDKQDDVMKQAREAAIADAKVSAQKLASDLGVSLVRIVSYSENGYNPGPIYYAKDMAMSAGAVAPSPVLPSGTNKITSNVSLVYEIR